MFRICLRVLPAPSLSETWLARMWALYEGSHDVDRDTFCDKTRRKFREVAVLTDRREAVVGFIGANWDEVALPSGARVFALYMGQAMLAHELRGSGWSVAGPVVLGLRGLWRARGRQVVLWQDALTVRTFLLVARHAVYHPHPTLEMPAELRQLRDHLGHRHYPSLYDAERGVVRKGHVLVTEPPIDPARLDDPHIRFFAEANPGYVHGDGLLQLTPLDASILLRAGVGSLFKRAGGAR
jgi:hypothetical protein